MISIFKSKEFHHYIKDLSAVTGSLILVIMLIAAIFAPIIAPQNPYDMKGLYLEDSLKPPIWMEGGEAPFILGTDDQGRDILSTILYGCRTSFTVGFSVIIIAGTIGVMIGLLAGFYGGLLDVITMRLADAVLSFSTTLIAMLFLGVLEKHGVGTIILAIVITCWVKYARTIRGSVLSVKEEDYISAAKALGANDFRIMLKHIFPNAISPILIVAAVNFGAVVMLEATLSFLGVGVPINKPSLGMMISIGKNYIYAGKWWLVVFPGAALILIVFSINLLADWLREEINPKITKGKVR
ncbi:MAG: ABC transporter permease [Candidatus Atribacteria bacterium]|jgi:peptide/nickel transport system permease protein|nr:ABC transporter permease [Candidatus Atribacteria bacterium]MCK4309327.1 ABC transporter permease [Candidatus Atribacteria bacterium]